MGRRLLLGILISMALAAPPLMAEALDPGGPIQLTGSAEVMEEAKIIDLRELGDSIRVFAARSMRSYVKDSGIWQVEQILKVIFDGIPEGRLFAIRGLFGASSFVIYCQRDGEKWVVRQALGASADYIGGMSLEKVSGALTDLVVYSSGGSHGVGTDVFAFEDGRFRKVFGMLSYQFTANFFPEKRPPIAVGYWAGEGVAECCRKGVPVVFYWDGQIFQPPSELQGSCEFCSQEVLRANEEAERMLIERAKEDKK